MYFYTYNWLFKQLIIFIFRMIPKITYIVIEENNVQNFNDELYRLTKRGFKPYSKLMVVNSSYIMALKYNRTWFDFITMRVFLY